MRSSFLVDRCPGSWVEVLAVPAEVSQGPELSLTEEFGSQYRSLPNCPLSFSPMAEQVEKKEECCPRVSRQHMGGVQGCFMSLWQVEE